MSFFPLCCEQARACLGPPDRPRCATTLSFFPLCCEQVGACLGPQLGEVMVAGLSFISQCTLSMVVPYYRFVCILIVPLFARRTPSSRSSTAISCLQKCALLCLGRRQELPLHGDDAVSGRTYLPYLLPRRLRHPQPTR
jgi:hypothetical protein